MGASDERRFDTRTRQRMKGGERTSAWTCDLADLVSANTTLGQAIDVVNREFEVAGPEPWRGDCRRSTTVASPRRPTLSSGGQRQAVAIAGARRGAVQTVGGMVGEARRANDTEKTPCHRRKPNSGIAWHCREDGVVANRKQRILVARPALRVGGASVIDGSGDC